MNLDDLCRYLAYWGTGNGDMRATKDVVRQKISANNANNATFYVKLDKKRRESSKRNHYIVSQKVIIKAIDIISTWPDQMSFSHTTASNKIVHKQRYASLPLLSNTHWVVWKWIEQRETIVHPTLQDRLALAIVNSKRSVYLPESSRR